MPGQCTSNDPLGTAILAMANMYEKIIPMVEEKQAKLGIARHQIVDGKMQDTMGSNDDEVVEDWECLSTTDHGSEV